MKNLSAIFHATLVKCLEGQPWGSKTRLAKDAGITTGMLGDILAGRAYGSEETKRSIAAALGYPGSKYEDFLNIGRQILAGQDPWQAIKSGQEPNLTPAAQKLIAEAPPATRLDGDLMIDVITTLEEFLAEQKKKLPPRAKAEIIVQLYELMKEEEEKGTPPMARFKLVAPLLSRALTLAVDEPLPKTG